MIFSDTKNYFETMIDELNYNFQREIADVVARITYCEREIQEINQIINIYNKYIGNPNHFEFLIVANKLIERTDELVQRHHSNYFTIYQK